MRRLAGREEYNMFGQINRTVKQEGQKEVDIMRYIEFKVHFCGMSEELYAEHCMIFKPNHTLTRTYSLDELTDRSVVSISELIQHIKADDQIKNLLGEWETDMFDIQTVFFKHDRYLLGLQEDKTIEQVFEDLNTDTLQMRFFVVGGASFHCEGGYKFLVRSKEKGHEHMPHVHVEHADAAVRFSLETLEPIDEMLQPHKRDYKKRILPYLKKNQSTFMELWNKNIHGYTTPTLSENDDQFYSVS